LNRLKRAHSQVDLVTSQISQLRVEPLNTAYHTCVLVPVHGEKSVKEY
jgi:hypothetical protein